MNNKYVVYSSPRTGSTLTNFLVYTYLKCKYKKDVWLGQFFNPYHYDLFFEELYNAEGESTGAINHTVKVPNSYRLKYKVVDGIITSFNDYKDSSVIDHNEETDRRLEIYDQCIHPCVTNFHANSECKKVFDYFNDTKHTFICTERENILEQLLSYGIATYTKVWSYRVGDGNTKVEIPEKKSITYDKNLFFEKVKSIRYYNDTKMLITNKIIITYEYIEDMRSPWDLYQLLGFYDWRDYIKDIDSIERRLTFKPPLGDKKQYFSNMDEIYKWYEETK